ncbi:MAG: GNAT family N-acetyltransferase [Prevotella sp.]|nr:GNAT family N-acetyltransferase [Prevotella sp.]
MNKQSTVIRQATANDAKRVAELIIMAMTEECCLHFCGEEHNINDFRNVLIRLVESDESQYSYRNTLCAVDAYNNIIGVCTSYDGGKLHQLRKAFIKAAKEEWGKDHSNMPDETEPGELYLDSLAVDPAHRGKGIASLLIKASIDKARQMGLPATGLLVDDNNPRAEALYSRLGFRVVGTNNWGGHPMKHMVVS